MPVGEYSDDRYEDISAQLDSQTSNSAVASIDTKGVVTTLQIGATQEITRQDENIDLVCSCLFFNSQCIIIQVCPDLYLI
jgi:hypothetical protein